MLVLAPFVACELLVPFNAMRSGGYCASPCLVLIDGICTAGQRTSTWYMTRAVNRGLPNVWTLIL